MAVKRRQWDEKTYRSTWEDVENWVQAVFEDFGCRTRITLTIPMPPDAVKPAVVVELYRYGDKHKEMQAWRDWKLLELRTPHSAEHWALQMLSQAWLELDLDRQRAERQATLL